MASFAVEDSETEQVCEKISDVIAKNSSSPWISIEFFPPKTDAGVSSLRNVMRELKKRGPIFADFTWGAGGSTSDLTLDLCRQALAEGLNPNMHLTCTNMEASKVDAALEGCKSAGISNILALRGDPPAGQEAWTAVEGGFNCALDLVRHIKSKYTDNFFCVSVAGYPEGHPTKMVEVADESELSETEKQRCSIDVDEATGKKTILVCRDVDYEGELDYLKEKVLAGASAIITQMFFDTEVYGSFVSACRARGITVPIVPGIMCISNYGGFKRMVKFCKTRVPQDVLDSLEAIKDAEDSVKQFGVTFGVTMSRRLLQLGAPGLHFYTLNSSVVTNKILDALDWGATAIA